MAAVEFIQHANEHTSWPGFRGVHALSATSRPLSQMTSYERMDKMRESKIRKYACRPTLIPPYLSAQIEEKLEAERRIASIKARRKNYQSALDILPVEQVDITGKVHGKGQRLLTNGQVLSVSRNRNPLQPYSYDKEEMHKHIPLQSKEGHVERKKHRIADPTRPMFSSSGYILGTVGTASHPYYLDATQDKHTATPTKHSRVTKPQWLTPAEIPDVPQNPSFQARNKPGMAGLLGEMKGMNMWRVDEMAMAKLRSTRAYWQRHSYPGFKYKVEN